jgi:hypothetical protein
MFARFGPILPAALLLAGCGGGSGSGVASTPAPVSSPTPTPTPNASLLGPLTSESFTNDAATETGRFYADARPGTDRAANFAPLTISYDASNQSYTVSTAGRSQTFSPADVDATQSSAAAQVRQKKSGALTESLTLTKPGTSGKLTYQYVGAGYWQRVTDLGDKADFTFDAFTYGAATPLSAVPRTGAAVYSVDLLGSLEDGIPVALSGSGTFQADFGTGQIATSGTIIKTSIQTGGTLGTSSFSGSGTISSAANAFNGSFSYFDFGQFNGSLQGRFYGPAGQEVGMVWRATQSDGRVAAGTLTGRQDATAKGSNFTLTDLRYSQVFSGPMASQQGRSATTLAYDASNKSFTYHDVFAGDLTYLPGDKVASLSDAKFDAYEHQAGDGTLYRLSLYKPGTGNPELSLTYSSFGAWGRPPSGGTYPASISNHYFVWGVTVDPNLFPRTGTAHYDGVIYGDAHASSGGAPTVYELGGKSSFDVDFAHLGFTGRLDFTGRDLATNAVSNLGSYSFDRGYVSGSGLSADISDGTHTLGYFDGLLFGSAATELGGTFVVRFPFATTSSPPGTVVTEATGVTIAKRAP